MKLSVVAYLTICLIEECAEIIQRACKALRFGWYEVQPGQDRNNVDRLSAECSDLIGVVEMLVDKGIPIGATAEEIKAKRSKVQEFMRLSRELGILEPESATQSIIDETKILIKRVYEYSPVGSNCHIVLDDGNLSDDHIKYCQNLLRENAHNATPNQLEIERKILSNLLSLPESDRQDIYISVYKRLDHF